MAERMVWVDCEMTGLDLARDALIEVAVVVTDAELVPLDDGLDLVINVAEDVLDTMIPFVRDMHASSGLTDAVRASKTTLGDAETAVLDYVRSHAPARRASALPDDRRVVDQGTRQTVVPAGVPVAARQGARPSRPRRHPREH